MLIVTSHELPGQKLHALGLVRGNIVSTRHIGRDMMASMKSVVGGEIVSYTEMTNEARNIAEARMVEAAMRLGADAIVSARFESYEISQGSVEMLAYGTAVKFIN